MKREDFVQQVMMAADACRDSQWSSTGKINEKEKVRL
jgi:hypothetical protein